jgi:hypothetical protein
MPQSIRQFVDSSFRKCHLVGIARRPQLVVAAILTSSLVVQMAAQQDAPRPVFRGGTAIVSVDVIVRDGRSASKRSPNSRRHRSTT